MFTTGTGALRTNHWRQLRHLKTGVYFTLSLSLFLYHALCCYKIHTDSQIITNRLAAEVLSALYLINPSVPNLVAVHNAVFRAEKLVDYVIRELNSCTYVL